MATFVFATLLLDKAMLSHFCHPERAPGECFCNVNLWREAKEPMHLLTSRCCSSTRNSLVLSPLEACDFLHGATLLLPGLGAEFSSTDSCISSHSAIELLYCYELLSPGIPQYALWQDYFDCST